ncbi:MAG: hypothetical protein ACE5G0_19865 [Rhodothermales bacterium]
MRNPERFADLPPDTADFARDGRDRGEGVRRRFIVDTATDLYRRAGV